MEKLAFINEIAEVIFDQMGQQGTEFYLFSDGTYGTRQEGSFSENEEEVIFTIPLSLEYWRITLEEWDMLDSDDHIKSDLGDEDKEEFIYFILIPQLEELQI